VTAFDLGLLAQKGSLFATRPSLFTHIADRKTYEEMTADMEHAVKRGHMTFDAITSFPLADAAKVHRSLEARETTGSIVLTP
jgi:NADPH2:quinone reductase